MGLGGGIRRLGCSSRAMIGVSANVSRVWIVTASHPVLGTRLMSCTCVYGSTTNRRMLCVRKSQGLALDKDWRNPKRHCHYSAACVTRTQGQVIKDAVWSHYLQNDRLTSQPTALYNWYGQCKFSMPYLINRKIIPLSRVLKCGPSFHARSFSSQMDDTEIHSIKNDPEVKMFLREIAEDFATETRNDTSSSSDSDGDSATDLKEALPSHDVNLTSQAAENLGSAATVPKEDDFCDEEYEDFYHDYEDVEEEIPELQLPISTQRGVHGVYDVEEVVTLLKSENATNIVVISVPREFKYVDHLVIVTGRSTRHLKAMSEQLKWVYKRKRGSRDPNTIKLEGQLTKDWMAVDIGNIAVHLFLADTRKKYDLETLWTVGTEWDPKVEEDADPFTLFVDWSETAPQMPTDEEETETTPGIQTGATTSAQSMESLTGWHGKP